MKQLLRNHRGRLFDPLRIRPNDLTLGGIARALSRIPRFSGNCDRNYSVAEHSLFVASLVPESYRFEALMHDAHECITGDIPSPTILILGSEAEHKLGFIAGEVRSAFGLLRTLSHVVEEADYIAMCCEILWAFDDRSAFESSIDFEAAVKLGARFDPPSAGDPEAAEDAFFEALCRHSYRHA
jgi:hypothetical protein